MRLINLVSVFTLLLVFSCFTSCKKSDSVTEFIANDSSFVGFKDWQLAKTYHGPDPLLSGTAHGNNDSTVTRDVYFKDSQNPVNGKYPIGTLIVKNSHNPDGTINEFTALAKRGNGFNPTANDWEFFMLSADGRIMMDNGAPVRGANLMDGMCITCHSVATVDYVYSKE
ncbi:MAG: hypothetical protein H6538_01505 [Bacteroidales bacterium]|nr:hypothetical protein [Bacteroidales bacterium]MCB9013529.1 hypothetical protein [Bacteroidales bacterium]